MLRADQLVKAVHDGLLPHVKSVRGALRVATDPMQVLELLLWAPRGVLVVLSWAGDNGTDDAGEDHVARQGLDVTVGYALGLPADAGLDLFKNRLERPSLLKLLDDVRAKVLAMVLPEDVTAERFEYGDCKGVTLPNGTPLAAYRFTVYIEAGLAVAEEDITLEIEE
jgi:hypothetical protein